MLDRRNEPSYLPCRVCSPHRNATSFKGLFRCRSPDVHEVQPNLPIHVPNKVLVHTKLALAALPSADSAPARPGEYAAALIAQNPRRHGSLKTFEQELEKTHIPRISRISMTPIKGFALSHPSSINLTSRGAEGDRDFFLIDDKGSVVSVSKTGAFSGFVPEYHAAGNELSITAPDGSVSRGEVCLGETIVADFWGHHKAPARMVIGPWAKWFSDLGGQNLRLVKASTPGGGIDLEPVTLLGSGTLKALGDHAGLEDLDDRRFRMLLNFSGAPAYAEDSWLNKEFQIGSARVYLTGPVKRCSAVTRNPDTGNRDLPLLRMLKQHRGLQQSVLGTGVCLGVYAKVTLPGTVACGDEIIAVN